MLAKDAGRRAFGDDPDGYNRARPGYPDWVYATLVERCGLGPGASVFEIGPGTGIATRPLLAHGAKPLVAIEPDARLAAFLSSTIADTALDVVVAPFEDVALPQGSFDLGVSATAFHWLDEDKALEKIASLLRPGGWWAAVWNVFGDHDRSDPFHEAIRELLDGLRNPSFGEKGVPFALDADARLGALDRVGAFDIMENHTRQWSLVLDADQTVALYATYSNVRARADREAALAEMGRIAREDFHNRVVRNMTTSLYIARRAVTGANPDLDSGNGPHGLHKHDTR